LWNERERNIGIGLRGGIVPSKMSTVEERERKREGFGQRVLKIINSDPTNEKGHYTGGDLVRYEDEMS
jgi:hypothetical protein